MMRKRGFGLLVIVCGLLLAVASFAQEGQDEAAPPGMGDAQSSGGQNRQPTAAEVQEMMQGIMGPMMGEMMSNMIKSMSKAMAEPQIAQNFAAFTRNYYQALVDRGFTEEEAMKIVTSTGVPSMGGKQ